MKRFSSILIIFALACVCARANAAYDLVSRSVTVEDLTLSKTNYFITVIATNSDSTSTYELAFDVYPPSTSIVGTFSIADETIDYFSSFVHKTRANNKSADLWYYCEENSVATLTIEATTDSTCTLSGSIQATSTSNGTAYTYNLSPITFAYRDSKEPPQPEDPYRFEPTEPTSFRFYGDVVDLRWKEDHVNITLNEMADSTYNWVELNLITDEYAWLEGDYTIDATGAANTLTASRGYLGLQNDDPCYVAIRKSKEFWGEYTPYYLVSGTVSVRYNSKGDTIFVTGEVTSKNGSVITLDVRSYNMLYVPEERPREPEFVTLAIDTVQITYISNEADSAANIYPYTFSFSAGDEFPQVIFDMDLSKPMELVSGTYTLKDSQLKGVTLFQNQDDFNAWFFYGETYVWESVTLTMSPVDAERWQYEMLLVDTIGSEYTFRMIQTPHIILYPNKEEEVDPKEQPYTDELKQTETFDLVFDSIIWKDETVDKDGIVDIYLLQKQTNSEGLFYFAQLGLYTSVSDIAAGTYPINSSEEEGTFSASLGRYGNVVIPCVFSLVDRAGWSHKIWFIIDGSISISYDEKGNRMLSGECVSYYGSTIRFAYPATITALQEIEQNAIPACKVLRNGNVEIIKDGVRYSILGTKLQ